MAVLDRRDSDTGHSTSSTLMSDTPRSGSPKAHHHHPPIPVPAVKEGGEDVLPAEADRRDEQREGEGAREKPPDSTGSVHEPDIFDKFSPARKRVILAIVAYSAFLSPVTSSVFLPSVPQMAIDLNTSPDVVNYSVAVFLVTIGAAPLIWSPLSGFYGRRPIYLASMPIHVVASIGVALSRNIGDIFATRILQGIGGCAVLSLGAGTIGDIYRPTERANAMGWLYSGALMGPSLAPLIAGVFTEYTALGWRSTQYWLAGCGALSLVLTYFFLPETSHPPLPHDALREAKGKRFIVYRFNPLTSLALLRWPNIAAAALISSCVMLTLYGFVTPLATAFETNYGITNTTLSGLLYLSTGGGNIIGARIAGPLCDWTVKKYIAKRGHRRPEDRLKAALIATVVIWPLSAVAYGWLVEYRAGGMGPPILMLIISGIALMLILTPINTYLVDCMQTRSAETIAVNNFLRYVFAAAASAGVLPMANSVGWGWTMTVGAAISYIAAGLILALIKWGHLWREKADAKYAPDAPVPADQVHGKDEESRVGETSRHSEHDHEGEDPGHLVPAPGFKKTGPPARARGASLARSASSRSDMPPVQEVLKRTASLSGASTHGGG